MTLLYRVAITGRYTCSVIWWSYTNEQAKNRVEMAVKATKVFNYYCHHAIVNRQT